MLPASIDTSISGTQNYEFSPDPGQCATVKTTVPITVTGPTPPVFTINTSYCQNSSPDSLPAVSDNGIPGSWSPLSIDTSSEGTRSYVFTSLPDDCSVTHQFELTVTVNPVQTPVFDLVTEYYFIDNPQVLPTLSDNGITGVWQPSTVFPGTGRSETYTFIPDGDQCSGSYSTRITVIGYPKFFTPNGDGINDY